MAARRGVSVWLWLGFSAPSLGLGAAFLCGVRWVRGGGVGDGGKRHCKINGLGGSENFVKKVLAFLARMWDYMPRFRDTRARPEGET